MLHIINSTLEFEKQEHKGTAALMGGLGFISAASYAFIVLFVLFLTC